MHMKVRTLGSMGAFAFSIIAISSAFSATGSTAISATVPVPAVSPSPSSSLSGESQDTPISVTQTSFIDEIADSPTLFVPMTRADLLARLNEGDLVSMGETHERGLERTYLAGLYSDLASALNPLPIRCLVETYNNLMPTTDDPVRAQFNKVCPPSIIFDNHTWVYTSQIATYLPQGRVLTHTGYRHTAPYALMYPADFLSASWVDTPPHGTITKQLPDDFASQGKKMRTHIMREVDDLVIEKLTRELMPKLAAGMPVANAVAQEVPRITHWAASPAFQFKSGEVAHVLEVARVNQSFNYEHAYLSLINREDFHADLLVTLLKSPEFAQLAATTQMNQLQMGVFIPESPKETFCAGSISITESGTIYAYAPNPSQSGFNTVVTISPTHGVQLQQSTY
jgi:hypothetical protein